MERIPEIVRRAAVAIEGFIIVALTLMMFVEGTAAVLVLEFIMISPMINHLKMREYHPLHWAVGGINLGTSGLIVLVICLIQTGALQLALRLSVQATLITVGCILAFTFFAAGVLNLIKSRKGKTETIDNIWME